MKNNSLKIIRCCVSLLFSNESIQRAILYELIYADYYRVITSFNDSIFIERRINMSLIIYNVLNRKKEEFEPIESGKVRMYACGITASGEAHVGHAYQSIVFDIIRK